MYQWTDIAVTDKARHQSRWYGHCEILRMVPPDGADDGYRQIECRGEVDGELVRLTAHTFDGDLRASYLASQLSLGMVAMVAALDTMTLVSSGMQVVDGVH